MGRAVAQELELTPSPARWPRCARISSSFDVTGSPIDRPDQIVGPQPGALARRVRPSRPAPGRRACAKAERPLQSGSTSLSATPMNPRATRPRFLQLRQDCSAWLMGTAKPMLLARRADGGVDADHLAARVDQRAAAVAEIDGRIGLDVAVEAGVEQFAADVARRRRPSPCARRPAGCRWRTPIRPPAGHQSRPAARTGNGCAELTLISAMSVSGSLPTTSARSVRPSASLTGCARRPR